jgi:imidazolonepropionase-like amidohydrolase
MLKRLLLALAALAFASSAGAVPPPPTTFAFVNVTVVPMDTDRVVPAQTVIVRNGRIESIGPANRTTVPRAAMTIDGRGRYLMPGLAEMHAHIPPQDDVEQWTSDVLFLYVANGITFARGMLGAPHHIALRERAARGEIVSPRIYTSGPSLNGNSVQSPDAGRRMVAEQKRAGYDFLKIHPGLDRARYDAIVAAAREHDIAWAGHVPWEVGLPHALAAGQATVDHLDETMRPLLREDSPLRDAPPSFFGWNLVDDVDEDGIEPLARRTREAGAWMVPTESLIRHVLLPEPSAEELGARDEMRYMPRATVEAWVRNKHMLHGQQEYDEARKRRFVELRAKLIAALNDEGVLLLGADAPQIFNVPGFAIHHELDMLVDAGVSPFDALASGTRNVARFLGEEQRFGTAFLPRS